MDHCVPNFVVTDNYVVQPVESIQISMVDNENVGFTHLVHGGHPMQAGPVIRLTYSNSGSKTNNELHPLEAEIQRDLEFKQKQLSRQNNFSVIHSIPEYLLEGVVKKSGQPVEVQQRTAPSVNETIQVGDEAVQLQHVLGEDKGGVLKNDQVGLPQVFQSDRQMVLQGKPYIIIPENSPLLNGEWKESKSDANDGRDMNQSSTSDDVPEMSQIPLTVQNYNRSESNCGESLDKTEKLKQESDSEEEDEGEEMEPVCDYEPDPESTAPANVEDEGKPNKCYMCFKSFRQKKNMYAHIRKIHSTQPKIEGGILCPLCKMHALRQEHLRNHFETLHDVKIEKEEKLFDNMEEFLSWKEYVERETLSFYVSKSSVKLLANNQQKTYYKCHRSGSYVTLKTERKKKLKTQGSNKIGATCPAAMEVTENVLGVNVIFWKTHVGHDNDLAHLVLSKEEKARIAECLSSGVPWDKILEKVKKDAEKTSNAPSRLTMISKQDLRNIKKVHDVKTRPDMFPARKKVCQGRKPMKERMLRRASQALVVEKADLLLNLLETTEVAAEFRPKICLMIDNLISTIKRRAMHKRDKSHKRRRRRRRIDGEAQQPESAEADECDGTRENVSTQGSVQIKPEVTCDQGTAISSNAIEIRRKRGRPKKKDSTAGTGSEGNGVDRRKCC